MKNEIFESNPQLKEVHVTSDGQCFYNDNDAKLHAKSLKDKKVELVLNPDHLEVVGEEIEETMNAIPAKADGSVNILSSTEEATKEEGTTDAPATEEASKEEVNTDAPATEEASKEEGTTDAPATKEASKEEVSTAAPATDEAPKVVKPSKNTK